MEGPKWNAPNVLPWTLLVFWRKCSDNREPGEGAAAARRMAETRCMLRSKVGMTLRGRRGERPKQSRRRKAALDRRRRERRSFRTRRGLVASAQAVRLNKARRPGARQFEESPKGVRGRLAPVQLPELPRLGALNCLACSMASPLASKPRSHVVSMRSAETDENSEVGRQRGWRRRASSQRQQCPSRAC